MPCKLSSVRCYQFEKKSFPFYENCQGWYPFISLIPAVCLSTESPSTLSVTDSGWSWMRSRQEPPIRGPLRRAIAQDTFLPLKPFLSKVTSFGALHRVRRHFATFSKKEKKRSSSRAGLGCPILEMERRLGGISALDFVCFRRPYKVFFSQTVASPLPL